MGPQGIYTEQVQYNIWNELNVPTMWLLLIVPNLVYKNRPVSVIYISRDIWWCCHNSLSWAVDGELWGETNDPCGTFFASKNSAWQYDIFTLRAVKPPGPVRKWSIKNISNCKINLNHALLMGSQNSLFGPKPWAHFSSNKRYGSSYRSVDDCDQEKVTPVTRYVLWKKNTWLIPKWGFWF